MIQFEEPSPEDPYQIKCVIRFPEKDYNFDSTMKAVVREPLQIIKVDTKFIEQQEFEI